MTTRAGSYIRRRSLNAGRLRWLSRGGTLNSAKEQPLSPAERARVEVWRRLGAHFDVLETYIHGDRARFAAELAARSPQLQDLFCLL
jgi:hypothetical protein